MAANNLPSADRLRQLLDYDHATGALTWKHRPADTFASMLAFHRYNAHFAGKIAGWRECRSKAKGGGPKRLRLSIDGREQSAHQVIWVLLHGAIPEGVEIDHKNGNPWDNRLDNLRASTHVQNMQNSRKRSDSTTLKGVARHGRKFVSNIRVNKSLKRLGVFETEEDAHAAYAEAAKQHFGEFARLE